jgi:4-hydroxybutyrate CoA-transferase
MSPGRWVEAYRQKLISAEEAVRVIESNMRVSIGSGCAFPQRLVSAMTGRADELENVEIIHLLTMGASPYTESQYQRSFRHNAFFVGSNVREAVNTGQADYIPVFLSTIPALFRDQLPIDVALIQVTPPDEHGFCSFGVSVDIVKPAAEAARCVIAEVNHRMPRTLGDAFIHVSKLHAAVEHSDPLPTLPRTEFTDQHRSIGQHVAGIIEDEATLQMGIGAIPDAVLSQLGDRRHLGIHTEMFSDGVIDLVDTGVVTNERKTLHPGKLVSSFLMGSHELYDYADNNPLVELHPTQYVNDPFVIAQNRRMVAINSAIQVDLTGQVCADSMGHSIFSGIGGQVDFIRGAAYSEGGKPVIALLSTAKGGTISRIVGELTPGAGVVTSRGDVHWVATEFGIANLHGRNLRQRAKALIEIAHPDFREQLLKTAREHYHLGQLDI